VKLGVSFVVPVHNGERWIDEALRAIVAQADGRPMEVLVVDDGSRDGSRAILDRWAGDGRVRLLDGERRGAAAALNFGIRHATHPIICQVDQDVIVQPGWMARLCDGFDQPDVGAVQGYYVADPSASVWARAMGLDLEHRYSRIRTRFMDHVCTGNSAYRAAALREVGLFDETLGYGYDNDMSYRLARGGWRLGFCREARSIHRWREGARAYLRQQYGFGFGRLDLVAKHRGHFGGDDVSGLAMMLHAPLMACVVAGFVAAALVAVVGGPWRALAVAAAVLLTLLVGERLVAGLQATRRFGDPVGLAFVPVHLLRDVAWVAALIVWGARRVLGQPTRPSDSM
jgi:glycosyltransferase involved in cell wall biosynthesis